MESWACSCGRRRAVAADVAASTVGARRTRSWGADYFPNVTLTTQDGDEVRFYDDLIKGKIVAINLIYTTCKYACPLETARLAQVQRLLGDRMGRDVFFYSITIDPEHDTPAVLKEYAEKFDAGPGWMFLTGKQDDIDLISRKTGPVFEARSRPIPTATRRTCSSATRSPASGCGTRRSTTRGFWPRRSATWLNSWQTAGETDAVLRRRAGDQTRRRASTPSRSIVRPATPSARGDRIGPDLGTVVSSARPRLAPTLHLRSRRDARSRRLDGQGARGAGTNRR